MITVANGRGPHAGQIRTRSRLGHRHGGQQRPSRQPGEPAGALLGVRVVQEVRQDHLELGAHCRQRDERPRRLLLQHDVVPVVGHAAAAVLLGNRHAQQPELTHLLEDVARQAAALLPLGILRHDLLLYELSRQLPEGLVVVVEQVPAHLRPLPLLRQ